MNRTPKVKQLTSSAVLEEHRRRGRRFDFLKERLANVDILEVWQKLETDLTVGVGRKNADRLGRCLDEAESNLRRAAMIEEVARQELDEFELHWRVAYGEWEWTAREALERAKKSKRISGMLTQEMVENWVAAHIPDYRKWREARRDLERNKNMAKVMTSAWESRRSTLRKLVDLIEPRRGVDTSLLGRKPQSGGHHVAAVD